MLHYKAISRTRKQKLADIVLIVFGFMAAAYTTIQTLGVRRFPFLLLFPRHSDLSLTFFLAQLMMAPSPESSPYGSCEG
jgi:proton-coupled amino acid transporter